MQSKISNGLDMKFLSIVLLKSDEKPVGAVGPKNKGGCVMSFVVQTIAKRKNYLFWS